MISIKPKKIKKQHVKVLAKTLISSEKSEIQDCSSVVMLDDCDESEKYLPACIGCKDDCKYYCQTQSKLSPNPPPPLQQPNPPDDNPCNASGIRARGEPILKSQKKDVSKKSMSKRIRRNAKK